METERVYSLLPDLVFIHFLRKLWLTHHGYPGLHLRKLFLDLRKQLSFSLLRQRDLAAHQTDSRPCRRQVDRD